jgi:hypothetical protein
MIFGKQLLKKRILKNAFGFAGLVLAVTLLLE